VLGIYEYCDESGTYSCKQFNLFYQRVPYDAFRLINEMDCLESMRKVTNPQPDVDYLPACKTFAEREKEQKQK